MQPTMPSRTALVAAMMRSLHSRVDPLPLLDDLWSERLVPEVAKQVMREQMPPLDGSPLDARLRAVPAYSNVITRSRFAEDALAAAIARGVRQAVLIGAGFDSLALRRQGVAREVAVYEIDHPATQELKRRMLAALAVDVPGPLHFLPADLAREGLAEVLGRSPFQREAPAFLSWLGVTMYLPREANLATLGAVARSTAPGSELVFSYVDQAMFEGGVGTAGFQAMQQSVSSVGEPFLSGFDPATLAADMSALGLQLVEDLDDVELVARLDPEGRNALNPHRRSRIARVQVR